MLSNKILVLLAVSCILMQFTPLINANCVCKEKGVDYCQACSGAKIVRPKPKPYLPNPDVELPPIGDNCWCSKSLVQPAVIAKAPCTKHKASSCNCNTKTYDYGPAISSPVAYGVPAVPYGVPPLPPKDDSLPADPISVSLAIQAGKAIGVPEAKLSYGFVQKPVDDLKKIYFSSIPEENLYKLKSDVITLKKRTFVPPPDEEILEEEEEEEAAAVDDEIPSLTYKELGYVPEKFKNPKFKEVSSPYVYAEEPAYPAAYGPGAYEPPVYKPKRPKKCGFKPGRIAPCRKGLPEVEY